MRALGRTAALATTVRQAVAHRERDALLLERVELAREVHESVMQRLFGVSMVLGSGRELSAADAERSAAEVEAALGELRDALDRSLEPTAEPSRTTLRAELERLGRQYKAVPISVWWEAGAEVPEGLEPLAVSVLGEALRNAEKHAKPTEVRIAITSADGAFVLEVRNDGIRRAAAGAGSGPRPAPRRLRVAAARRHARVRPRGRRVAGPPGAAGERRRRASSAGSAPVAERSDTGERPLRVLIVDDHAVVQWGFKVLLGRQRWVERCVVASDPEEGLAAAERLKPHVALVDLFLGERSGAELCEAIRSASPKTRVLLISGRRLDLAAGGEGGGRLGLRLQGLERRRGRDGGADGRQGDDRLRPPGGGAGDAAEPSASARSSTLIASGATNREIAARALPLPAHGQGARQRALPQARRQEPRRGRPPRRAPRPDPLSAR